MNSIAIIMKIVILILELINKGLDEKEIIEVVSSEYNVTNKFIKNIFK